MELHKGRLHGDKGQGAPDTVDVEINHNLNADRRGGSRAQIEKLKGSSRSFWVANVGGLLWRLSNDVRSQVTAVSVLQGTDTK